MLRPLNKWIWLEGEQDRGTRSGVTGQGTRYWASESRKILSWIWVAGDVPGEGESAALHACKFTRWCIPVLKLMRICYSCQERVPQGLSMQKSMVGGGWVAERGDEMCSTLPWVEIGLVDVASNSMGWPWWHSSRQFEGICTMPGCSLYLSSHLILSKVGGSRCEGGARGCRFGLEDLQTL
jgi:hypothetical protein